MLCRIHVVPVVTRRVDFLSHCSVTVRYRLPVRGLLMNLFVVGVSTLTLWISLSTGVFAATPSPLEVHPSSTVPGATISIGGKGFGAFRSALVNRVTVGGIPALIQRWES